METGTSRVWLCKDAAMDGSFFASDIGFNVLLWLARAELVGGCLLAVRIAAYLWIDPDFCDEENKI